MCKAFIDDIEVSPLGATLPACLAKSSLAWPALFSLFGNNDVRNKLFNRNVPVRRRSKKSYVCGKKNF